MLAGARRTIRMSPQCVVIESFSGNTSRGRVLIFKRDVPLVSAAAAAARAGETRDVGRIPFAKSGAAMVVGARTDAVTFQMLAPDGKRLGRPLWIRGAELDALNRALWLLEEAA